MAELETKVFEWAKERRERTLIADPEPRAVHYPLVSVDDHLVEPPDIFEGRMPSKLAADAPRIIEDEDGMQWWLIEGNKVANFGGNAVKSWEPKDYYYGPVRFDEIRPATWNIHERVKDMDRAGIYASLNFPSTVFGFAGQAFMRMADRDLGLACMRAYNDWLIDVWAGSYPDRIIPSQLPWLHGAAEAAQEVRRNAERGFKAIAFTENPEKLGLPSLYTDYWDPFFAACADTDTVLNLHVGSSSEVVQPSADSPIEVVAALFQFSGLAAATDWIYAKVPVNHPGLKIALSEAGCGWVPSLIDRLKYVDNYLVPGGLTDTWEGIDIRPFEVLRRNFWFCTYWDPSALVHRDLIGIDRITLESDYPHPDSTWPDTQASLSALLDSLPATRPTCSPTGTHASSIDTHNRRQAGTQVNCR